MRNTLNLFLLFSLFMSLFYSVVSQGSTLEKCLSDANHSTQSCVEQNVKILTLDNCFNEAEKIKSDLSKENMRQFCFYSVSEFPTLKSCLAKSEKMHVAINHDEALFECVRQFQNQMSQNQCDQISLKMRYPEKLKHLKRNCEQL